MPLTTWFSFDGEHAGAKHPNAQVFKMDMVGLGPVGAARGACTVSNYFEVLQL